MFLLFSLLVACAPDSERPVNPAVSGDSGQGDSVTTEPTEPTEPADQGRDVDDDGDGFSEDGSRGLGEPDCDDSDADIHPGADEVCDYIDNNCDGSIDDRGGATDWYPDEDGDGCSNQTTWVSVCEGDEPPDGYLPLGMPFDCDDTSPEVCTC